MLKKILLGVVFLMSSFGGWAQHNKEKVTVDSVSDWGTISFEALKKTPLGGVMHDRESLATLDPNNFDLEVEVENDFLYEKPKLHIVGDTIILDIHPRGDWCECLFPTNLNIQIVSTQKEGAYDN